MACSAVFLRVNDVIPNRFPFACFLFCIRAAFPISILVDMWCPFLMLTLLCFYVMPEFATDIACVHLTKQVTLLHSRQRLLPRFDARMHASSAFTIYYPIRYAFI